MPSEKEIAKNKRLAPFLRRFTALIRKETRQMWRDKSNLLVGLILPLALILLFGYGLTFDVKNAGVAVVLEDRSPIAQNVLSGLQGSAYLVPQQVADMQTAADLLNDETVDAIVRIPPDFAAQFYAGNAQIQLITNGINSSTASSMESYITAAIAQYAQLQNDRLGNANSTQTGGVTIVQRMWFNEAGNSTWYLVPGLLVLVLTLIGAFLTSLLIAREWERGTLESLFVTPVKPLELVLAKLAPYMLIGAVDLGMCLVAAKVLFDVPIRGSLVVLVLASLLYLLVSLAIGLLISGKTRNQFQASQLAMLASFLPAMMLSGFVFDLRNVPSAIQIISHLLPATYFMELVKTLFLAGDNTMMAIKNSAVLAVYAVVLIWLATRTLAKKLD
ncbi:MAG: ABC transporter permease [Moraxella sp.]|nr:ABC transporter permease [Moraxella sp.]